MKILYGSSSPYSAKVRMAARFLDLDAESVLVQTEQLPEILIGNNPLGKIPVILEEDGAAVYDSRAIMQYLNRKAAGKLFPRNAAKRTEAEVLEALCDGITDCLLAIVYERRFHPPEKVHEAWIERQWQKVVRGLDHLDRNVPKTGKTLHGGHFALAAMLGYLDLRFPGEWEKGRTKLRKWPAKFEKFFADYRELKPRA